MHRTALVGSIWRLGQMCRLRLSVNELNHWKYMSKVIIWRTYLRYGCLNNINDRLWLRENANGVCHRRGMFRNFHREEKIFNLKELLWKCLIRVALLDQWALDETNPFKWIRLYLKWNDLIVRNSVSLFMTRVRRTMLERVSFMNNINKKIIVHLKNLQY